MKNKNYAFPFFLVERLEIFLIGEIGPVRSEHVRCFVFQYHKQIKSPMDGAAEEMPRPAAPEAPLRPGRVCAAPPSSARARGAAASPPRPPPLRSGFRLSKGAQRPRYLEVGARGRHGGDPRGPLQTRAAGNSAVEPDPGHSRTPPEAGGSDPPAAALALEPETQQELQ